MKFVANSHADSLIYQTRAHHVQLSSMADVKASTLITLSSVLLTLSVPRVQRAETGHEALIVLMTFCLATIMLAAYAAMPKYEGKKHGLTLAARQKPRFNLLFFGDFNGMSYAEFKAAMEIVLNNPDRNYEAQLREIHSIGIFLAKTKYHYLRLAYLTFMSGLVTSCITYLIVR